MYLESATPAVDQPVSEVDKREVDKVVCVHFPQVTFGPQLTKLPLKVSTEAPPEA
jgi:hypothetical protein